MRFNKFYVVVLAVVGLVAVVVQVLHLPVYIGLVAASVGVLVCAVRYALDRLGGSSTSSAPEDPAKLAARARKDRIRALRRRLGELVRVLRANQTPTRLRYRERGALPWWLVLGPDGHGKSSLLHATPGLREVAPDEQRAHGEPRLFVGDDAVFLELPASTDPDTAAVLAAMFTRIHRWRRRSPLTGALVVHRADALLADADADAAVRAVRAQLDLAAATLAVQVPVLLVVSGLDRVAGFAELIAGCSGTSRVLGTTLPPREGKASVRTAVGERLGGVLDWVRQRCHGLVGRADPGTHRQSRLYGFWQQFDRLAALTADFAGQLAAAPLPGGDPLRVRGVYFTAARPGPVAPEDLFAARLAQRAGGVLPPGDGDPPPISAAFVADLFTVELPRDSQYAARLSRHYRRRFTRAALVAVCLAALAAALARGSTLAARDHESLFQTTLDSTAAIASRRPGELPTLADLEVLRRAALAWRAPDGPDWALLRTDRLADAAEEALRSAVCRRVLRPLAARSAAPLRQFAARFLGGGLPAPREYEDTHDRLRFYLLLTAPADDTLEHAPWDKEQRAWLTERALSLWADLDQNGPDPRRAEILQTHVDLLPTAAAGPGDPCSASGHARAGERDAKLVADVRQILLRNPPDRDLVDRMVDRIGRDRRLRPITVRDLTTANYVRGEVSVAPAFTRPGWDAFTIDLRRELDDRSDQPWVLGKTGSRDTRAQRCTKLRNLYVDRYIDAWTAFVRGLRITSPGNWPQAAAIFEELGEDLPLVPVFAAVAEHTAALPSIPCTDDARTDALTRLISAPPAAPLRGSRDSAELTREFARLAEFSAPAAGGAGKSGSSPLDSYHKRLQDVRSLLDRAIDNVSDQPALCSTLADAIGDVDNMLQRGNLGGWKDPLTTLLLPPLTSLLLHCHAEHARNLNAAWCAAVVLPLERTLADKYPFVLARSDARLADIELLLHPQTGEIAKFRDKSLSAFVTVGGHDITAAALGTGASFHLDPAVVDLLDAAHELGLLLYGDGEVGLDAGLTMRCENSVNKVVLRVDEAVNTYFCSINQAQQIHWPGKSEPRRAELEAFGANARTDIIPRTGEFGLFRLLEEGTPTHRAGQSTFTISIVLPRHNFGSFQLTFHPREFRGGNLFYGFSGDRFLAPFRAPGLHRPPHALFSGLPYHCQAAP